MTVTGTFCSRSIRHFFCIFAIPTVLIYDIQLLTRSIQERTMKRSTLTWADFFSNQPHMHRRVPLRYVAIFCTILNDYYLMAKRGERFAMGIEKEAEVFMIV